MSPSLDTRFFGIQEEITLTQNGVWLSNGEEITHPGTLNAFNRSVFRTANGFEIRLGSGDQQEKKSITVEDTFYFVTSLNGTSEQGFTIRLNDGRTLPLNPETLAYQNERLTCKVPHFSEKTHEEAKFLIQPYYSLLKLADQKGDQIEIIIQGKKIKLT